MPALPRTDNALEQFYRRVKTEQRADHRPQAGGCLRRPLGRGFAVYATAASATADGLLTHLFASVSAVAWQQERLRPRHTQPRQTKMRRFHLHRAAPSLIDLETRWAALTLPS